MWFRLLRAACAAALLLLLPCAPAGGLSGLDEQPRAAAAVLRGMSNEARALRFGIYPGGPTGEVRHAAPVDQSTVFERVRELRRATAHLGRPLVVHLYISWYQDDAYWINHELDRYHAAGCAVIYSVRYEPPAGREGDAEGFARYVREFARRHGNHPGLYRLVVGNEANVVGVAAGSDGRHARAIDAVALGTIAAREELDRIGSRAEVGVNFGVTHHELDAAFLQELQALGGQRFRAALGFVGINVYPGLWPPIDTGDPYLDMLESLTGARASLELAGLEPALPLDILENGFPTPDEDEHHVRFDGFFRAVVDHHRALNIDGYAWFSLWDADSGSPDRYAHYGLLRSDLSLKPAFERYRALLADTR